MVEVEYLKDENGHREIATTGAWACRRRRDPLGDPNPQLPETKPSYRESILVLTERLNLDRKIHGRLGCPPGEGLDVHLFVG